MSLFSQAVTDVTSFITRDGIDITLTEPGEDPVTVKGMVFRSDIKVDPDTNAQFNDPYTAVHIPLSSLSTIPSAGWAIETTDATGATVSGTVSDDIRKHHLPGFVTLFIEVP